MTYWHKIYETIKRMKKRKKGRRLLGLGAVGLIVLLFLFIQVYIILTAPGSFNPQPGKTVKVLNPQISFKYSFSPGYIKIIKLDGKDVTKLVTFSKKYVLFPLENLKEGWHKIEISYHPIMALWPIKREWSFSVDTSPPTISLHTPKTNDISTNKNEFLISGKTESECNVEIIHEGKTYKVKVNPEGDFEEKFILNPGKNKFTIVSKDRAENISKYEINALFDSNPPKLSNPFPPDGKVIKEVDPIISAAVNEEGIINKIEFKINGKAVPGEYEKNIITYKPEKLSEGKHKIELNVTDSVGFKDSIKWSFVVDSTEDFGRRTQILGAIGEDVKDLQKRLSSLGYLDKKNITKVFDEKTLEAVKKFQAKNDLNPDGVVGPATIEKMSYSVVVSLSQFTLYLMSSDGDIYKTYPIACGSPEYPTPTGDFIIINKIKNPTWIPPDSPWAKEAELTKPGPDNPLGTRWIELNTNMVGIHGTNYPGTVGMNVSHGCVRMTIPDVEDLYEYVNIGTRVTIKDPILPPPTPVPIIETPVPIQTATPVRENTIPETKPKPSEN